MERALHILQSGERAYDSFSDFLVYLLDMSSFVGEDSRTSRGFYISADTGGSFGLTMSVLVSLSRMLYAREATYSRSSVR